MVIPEERFIEILEKEEIPTRYGLGYDQFMALKNIATRKGELSRAISLAYAYGIRRGRNLERARIRGR